MDTVKYEICGLCGILIEYWWNIGVIYIFFLLNLRYTLGYIFRILFGAINSGYLQVYICEATNNELFRNKINF